MERDRLAAQGAEDSMAESHRRDYAEKARLDMLRAVIEDFLEDPPSRFSEKYRSTLSLVVDELKRESAHIVLVWN